MIRIDRQETQVKVTLDNGPLGSNFPFTWECGNVYYAALLTRHFSNNLNQMIQSVREEEYNKGYKDGRAKRAKRSWFSPLLRLGM